jgi:hypothetical protein
MLDAPAAVDSAPLIARPSYPAANPSRHCLYASKTANRFAGLRSSSLPVTGFLLTVAHDRSGRRSEAP